MTLIRLVRFMDRLEKNNEIGAPNSDPALDAIIMPEGVTVMPFALAAGLVLMCLSAGLDVVVRLRMRRAGEKNVFSRGMTLDYRRYLSVRAQFGWSAWPLYLELPTFIIGLILLDYPNGRLFRADLRSKHLGWTWDCLHNRA